MGQTNGASQQNGDISGRVEDPEFKGGMAKILYTALSNGCGGVINPLHNNSVEEQKLMGLMIQEGLLAPLHFTGPESLRYKVTDSGRRIYESLVRDGYFNK